MENYIAENKAAWEEAFDRRSPSWGADIAERIRKEDYPFFTEEMKAVCRSLPIAGKTVGQFCCNNGRELLSLVKSGKALRGIGFDIAENQVAFANRQAAELGLPCDFAAVNIYDIGDRYREQLDVALITVGALCWFRDLDRFFAVVSGCMKPGAIILIQEEHPCANMLAAKGEALFDPAHRLECKYSYFEHEWIANDGIYYMTGKTYPSRTFTDYTHSLSEIISAMCRSFIVITGMQEFDHCISGTFDDANGQGYPLSVILKGRKEPA